jgi:hypothetical protein
MIAAFCHAQTPTIKTVYSDTTIQANKLDRDSSSFYEIKVELQLKGALDHDTTVQVQIKTISSNGITPEIKDNPIHIPKSVWKIDSSATSLSTNITLKIRFNKDFKKEVYMYLQVPGSDTVQQIVVVPNGVYTGNKPFWVEMGANFDMIDGLQPNNLFTGVFMYKRDIRNLKKFGSNDIGLFAGVYESKSISNRMMGDSNYTQYNDKSEFRLMRHDSFPVFRDSGAIESIQTVRNVSLFISPQLRLTTHSANADGLHVFASVWLELQWQRVTTEYDYSKLKRIDTIWLPNVSLDPNLMKKGKSEVDFRTHYWGLGLPIYFKEGDVNVFFNPTIGRTNQSFESLNSSERRWSFFYIFQFRLNEEKYGFAFTGEVRGLIRENIQPIVSLALTKKFDLTKLIEFK